MARVAVVGGGAWGSVFAVVARDAGNDVTVWVRRDEQAREINAGANERYCPGLDMSAVTATTSLPQALAHAAIVVVAVPSNAVRETMNEAAGHVRADATIVSLVKGVEASTLMLMTDVIAEATNVDPGRVVACSGPNLSAEIARRKPTGTLVAGKDAERAAWVAARIHTGYFRPYVATDVVGVEVGGVVKNIVAMAVGASAGMDLGVNARAYIINRGLMEMARLGIALGANAETFLGLAGLGDLVATSSSPLSRNYSFGYRLGQGMSVTEALAASAGTVEGARSCPHVLALAARHGVAMPISEAAQAVIDGRMGIEEAALGVFRAPRVTDGVEARMV
ncbi:MAG: NAD(P)H-dependent glycerol-3-phosphate dehydrogenase [Actinomycetaceae bacterium]|nr:NAD(P)H-dependent glycerol-3-phosphate dehydrogenase [Actinomycetaceae bacterium]